jgi:hypothetical protein
MTSELQQVRREDQLGSWRRDQLVRSGFPHDLATSVARDARFDLHALIELVERGCPPDLAVRILAPIGVRIAEA